MNGRRLSLYLYKCLGTAAGCSQSLFLVLSYTRGSRYQPLLGWRASPSLLVGLTTNILSIMYNQLYIPNMFSRVILTPRGVKAGNPFGNPSTGLPATWRPRTATDGSSSKLRERGCCLGNLGNLVREGRVLVLKDGLGV